MFCDKDSILNILKAKEKAEDEIVLKNIVCFDTDFIDTTHEI